jgi:hypothetical protein
VGDEPVSSKKFSTIASAAFVSGIVIGAIVPTKDVKLAKDTAMVSAKSVVIEQHYARADRDSTYKAKSGKDTTVTIRDSVFVPKKISDKRRIAFPTPIPVGDSVIVRLTFSGIDTSLVIVRAVTAKDKKADSYYYVYKDDFVPAYGDK